MKLQWITVLLVALSTTPAVAVHHKVAAHHKNFSTASKMTVSSVNQAVPSGNAEDPSLIVKAEVLLDRKHFSLAKLMARMVRTSAKLLRHSSRPMTLK
jgi:hypothetical protein